MLYGNSELQKKVIDVASREASKIGGISVFGSSVGSISFGTTRFDSDYDTRFLYYNPQTLQSIREGRPLREKDVVYRYYPQEEQVYEWIPLWDITALLYFLHEPRLDQKFSYGLYNLVPWTFYSPYSWDPYGLSQKLMPLANLIFDLDLASGYFRNFIQTEFHNEDGEVLLREYLYSARAAISLEWLMETRSFAPVHLDTLLAYEADREIVSIVRMLMEQMREWSVSVVKQKQEVKHKNSRALKTSTIPYLNAFITAQMDKITAVLEQKSMGAGKSPADCMKIVDHMFDLVLSAIQDQKDPIKGVNDGERI